MIALFDQSTLASLVETRDIRWNHPQDRRNANFFRCIGVDPVTTVIGSHSCPTDNNLSLKSHNLANHSIGKVLVLLNVFVLFSRVATMSSRYVRIIKLDNGSTARERISIASSLNHLDKFNKFPSLLFVLLNLYYIKKHKKPSLIVYKFCCLEL